MGQSLVMIPSSSSSSLDKNTIASRRNSANSPIVLAEAWAAAAWADRAIPWAWENHFPDTGVNFEDVAGCDGAKLELAEVVDFL